MHSIPAKPMSIDDGGTHPGAAAHLGAAHPGAAQQAAAARLSPERQEWRVPAGPATRSQGAVQDQGLIAEPGFSGMGARAIIEQLDTTPVAGRNADLMASIRPGELVLAGASKREARVPMPHGEFHVSVAPYVDQTHSCHFHSLITGVGELQNQDLDVTVTNSKTGKILIEDSRKTYDNGFVGLWLPRGIDATLTISSDGKSAMREISTKNADEATCLTTLQLS